MGGGNRGIEQLGDGVRDMKALLGWGGTDTPMRSEWTSLGKCR